MANYEKLLKYRPANVAKKLAGSKLLLINSQPVFQAFLDQSVIVMACNTRIKHVIPGILKAGKEMEAIVAFELAKSECNPEGGYTGFTPKSYVETILEYAEALKYDLPFIIHGDHITVPDTTEKKIEEARQLISAQISAGYSSFAIDASHNEMDDNIRITVDLAKPIQGLGLGLEVEIGEIKLVKEGGELTTVDEAWTFIKSVKEKGINPALLAINNGSKHGNYAPGEEPHIDLKRTKEIYNAIRPFSVAIAQHGITGTPLPLIGQFAEAGIRKGNIGTEWQNIAHSHFPPELMAQLKKWTEENKKDIKFTTKVFKKEIDNIPDKYKKEIEDSACLRAKEFLKALRSEGTARKLLESIK